jgi:hypothetical protein
MNINEYIQDKWEGNPLWFTDEVSQGDHLQRITSVVNNKYYLQGKHKILLKEDYKYKGKEYITSKLVLQLAKHILNFHSTYLLGKPISLVGSENKVKEYQNIYRKGHYNNIDFKILDKVGKYGDAYEYIYLDDNKNIQSRIIPSEDAYPVLSEEDSSYIAFIEYYTKISNSVSYYNVYYTDRVDSWSNAGGEFNLIDSKTNISGLPIHYFNLCDWDDNFGVSMLDDLIPIFDKLEELMSKLNDSIYTLSLNPIPIITGQELQGSVSADAVGYNINLESGSDFKYANAQMDYNTIKLYLDRLQQYLNQVASMPSIVGGNTNVANVSEVSLEILYELANIQASLNEKWFREGIEQRFDIYDKLLALKGVTFNDSDYIDVEFNVSKPINSNEVLQNLQTQFNMGAISIQTIIEKSPITTDVSQELKRLKKEDKEKQKNNPINNNGNMNMTNNSNVDSNGNIVQPITDTQSVGQ